jgi:hypothetical protein
VIAVGAFLDDVKAEIYFCVGKCYHIIIGRFYKLVIQYS